MKFAEHLSAHITPEWRKQYIKYEELKKILYEALEKAPLIENVGEDGLERYNANFEERFFQLCSKELLKINIFFSEKMSEARRKLATLQEELNSSLESETSPEIPSTSRRQPTSTSREILRKGSILFNLEIDSLKDVERTQAKKMKDLKLAFSEFYLSVILLQNFQKLNFTGFRKILKKYDKLMSKDSGAIFRENEVKNSTFFISKDADDLIQAIETIYINDLEKGNRQKAMCKLRVPPLEAQQNPWTTFRLGLFSGVFFVLVAGIVLAAVFIKQDEWRPALRMYRSMFLVIFFCLLLGINTYGWRKNGVNHVLIFELDPRNNLTYQQLLEISSFFGLIWGLSVLAYIFSELTVIPVYVHPLTMAIFLVLFLLNPFKILYHRARFWLLKVLGRILLAGFVTVRFADFWLADQLNSLVTVFLDLEYLICFYAFKVEWHPPDKLNSDLDCYGFYYGIRPLIAVFPAWFRFAQCIKRYRDTKSAFPHLVNAGKYSTTFIVVIFSALASVYKDNYKQQYYNPFFYLWIVSALVSSLYALLWDIKMDWGLFDKNAGENKYLREEIVYPHKVFYYLAIVEDFFLRFGWTLTVSIGQFSDFDSDLLVTIVSILEVFRRFVWNFFRLENEHLNNVGQFRAVRDISITPFDKDDLTELLKMMDQEDGVVNRKNGKVTWQEPVASRKKKFDYRKLGVIDDEDEEEEDEEGYDE